MTYSFSTTGAVNPVIRDFPVEETAKINAGVPVYLDENGVVNADGNGELLGVCAEAHSGEKDMLNARSNGTRIRVDITSGAVYSLGMAFSKAVSFADGSVIFKNDGIITAGAKGCLVLIEKAEGSECEYGDVFKVISAVVDGENVTVTVDGEKIITAGDKFIYVPVIGEKGRVSADGNIFYLGTEVSSPEFTVVSCDVNTITVHALMTGKIFDR